MDVTDINCTRDGAGRLRVSADVGGDELWFEIPADFELPDTVADSFVIMALAPSMLRNEPLRVAPDYPISSTLADNLIEIQKIFNCWNPAFRIIPIEAQTTDPVPSRDAEASMFSGGVDSLHTLMRHRDRSEGAILVGGFDMSVSREKMVPAQRRNAELAEHLGARLTYVHTNQIAWGSRTGVSRHFWYSAYLAAAALFLRYKVVRIPAGHTYATLNPTGSHVVLDSLWSNGVTRFVHSDNDVPRTQKVQSIAHDPYILERLQVCWDRADENCGECGKCVRTMLTLNLLGYTGPFPRTLSTREMGKTVIKDWHTVEFNLENRRLAAELGRPEVERALKDCLARYHRRRCLREFDNGFLYGSIRRLRRKWLEGRQGKINWVGVAESEL